MRRLRRALLLLAAAPLLLMAQPTGSSEASAASARQPAVPGAMATDPLVMASQQLVESSADQYSDLWLEEATDTVFVGSVNAEADRRVQAVTNQFPECPTSAVSSAVRVERSSADLETIRGALFEDPLLDALLEPAYSYDGPDAKTGQVLLGVIRAPERLMSMVINKFGTGVRVVVDTNATVAGSRLSDTSPFYGGGRIYNATLKRLNTTSEIVGHSGIREVSSNGWDGALIVDKPYLSSIWYGSISSNLIGTVKRPMRVPTGNSTGVDGSFSGERCDGQFTNMNFCQIIDYTKEGYGNIRVCNLDVTTGSSSGFDASARTCPYDYITGFLLHFGSTLLTG